MADDKKKPAAPPPVDPDTGIAALLIGLFLFAALLAQLMWYVSTTEWGNFTNIWNYFLHSYLYPFWSGWKIFAVVVSAVFMALLTYSQLKLKALEEEEELVYGLAPKEATQEEEKVEREKNKKWAKVEEHAHSTNPADWRLAIMEADIMLEEALRSKGFPGDTVGEMLKSAQPSDLLTLNTAWEAHKVRNNIAHSGSDFELNEREKNRVIMLFEAVFKELGEI